MRISTPFRYIPILGLLFAPVLVNAQKVIDYPPKIVVICKDGDDRKPLAGVKVCFRKGDTIIKTLTTDACGRCLILRPSEGTYSIMATKAFYFTFSLAKVNVPPDQTVVLEIPMDVQPDKMKKGSKSVAVN